PNGYTGATGSYCNSQCHTAYALNMAGGGISISGLPSIYTAFAKYTFSLMIRHNAVDRKKFGFAVIAVNAAGTAVGTFSTTNAYATTNGSELVSSNPPALTTATNSFTFDNLSWTAPSTTTGDNSSITFYYVGNAANNNMSTSGDYVYAGSVKITSAGSSNLPLQLIDFTAAGQGNSVVVRWATTFEQNTQYFGVERSDDGLYYTEQGHVKAAGNSDLLKKYVFNDSLKGTTPTQLFYRIVTVDLDGRKTYSPVRTLGLETTRTYIRNYYPNPVQAGKEVQLELESAGGPG
ncbi:MAG: choice-of-anchor V domain-containing protein, partial [Chitinophagaceae bacterium]